MGFFLISKSISPPPPPITPITFHNQEGVDIHVSFNQNIFILLYAVCGMNYKIKLYSVYTFFPLFPLFQIIILLS